MVEDKRRFNKGTVGNKGGRKPKDVNQEMIEKLSVFTEDAYRVLGENIKKGKYWAIRLWFDRMYGKAKEYSNIEFSNPENMPQIQINWGKSDNIK